MKNNIKKDERTKKQTQKAYSEAYYVIMIFLFITIIVKQMFLHQRFIEYSIEFAAFALGGVYALIRSLFCGIVSYNKKIMLFVPVIISVVLTSIILFVNFNYYKEIENLKVLFARAFIAFIIMLAFGYVFIYIVTLINKKRIEKLERKHNED